VNAPIQSATWEVHLPRGWKVDGKQPVRHAAAPEPPPLDPAKEQAREAWTNAIESYKKNDFRDAQRWLDASRSYADKAVVEDAATMDNVGRLQSNLDVLLPAEAKAPESTADDLLTRRVRDLANAKTTDAQLQQSKYEEQARKALLAGDDSKAVEALEEVTKLAKDIRVTEQKESNEQADKLSNYSQVLEEANDRVAKKSKSSGSVAAVAGRVSGELRGGSASANAWAEPTDSYSDEDESVAFGGKEQSVAQGATRLAPAAPPPPPPPRPAPVVAPYPASDEPMTLEEAEAEVADDYDYDYDYDDAGAEVDVVGERSVVDTEQASASTTMTSDFLQRIPTGRSYQSVAAPVAGIVADAPDPTPAPARPTPKTVSPSVQKPGGLPAQSGRPVIAASASPAPEVAQSGDGELGYLQAGGPSWSATREPPKKRAEKADEDEEQARNENTLLLDGVNTTDPTTGTFSANFNYDAIQEIGVRDASTDAEYGPSPTRGDSGGRAGIAVRDPRGVPVLGTAEVARLGHRLGPEPTPPREVVTLNPVSETFHGAPPAAEQESARAQVSARRSREKAELKLALERERLAAAQVKSRAKANRNVAPDTRQRRNPLVVEASPLTPALPLDGARVDHSAALLDAGEFPTFVYIASPDPKSDTFKE